jgi:hypothetical protein
MKRITRAALAILFAAAAALPLASTPAPVTVAPVTVTTTTAVQTCDRVVQEDEAGWSDANPCASRLPAWYDACASRHGIDHCLTEVRKSRG